MSATGDPESIHAEALELPADFLVPIGSPKVLINFMEGRSSNLAVLKAPGDLRVLEIDKMSTATGTDEGGFRPYRFGYGVLDANLNSVVDPGEKKVYFEISDYSTQYVFFGSPD